MSFPFFHLPREIRDIIYTNLLLNQPYTLPSLSPGQKFMSYDHNTGSTTDTTIPSTPPPRFKKIYDSQSLIRGEFGCAYALDDDGGGVPPTVASFLCCNRQIYAEMQDVLARLERKKMVSARLDCIAEDETFFYFTWVGVPVVESTMETGWSGKGPPWGVMGLIKGMGMWMLPAWFARLLPLPTRLFGRLPVKPISTTRIPRLTVDVRIVGNRANKGRRTTDAADRTGWAICAALKRLFDKGPYLAASQDQSPSHILTIDELVLNVVSPSPPPPKFLPEDFPVDGPAGEGTVHPRTVARELVSVWGKMWAGDEFRGGLYGGSLLGRIGWVRVCVDGETFRVREVRGVLERGRRERRRIAERVGW